MAEVKSRACIEILSYLTSFCMTHRLSDAKLYPGSVGFVGGLSDAGVQVGDLVNLSAAPTTPWHISWVHQIEVLPHDRRYLLESIHTGELCWWSNVGVSYLDRDSVGSTWRWSDGQFAFKERWWRVCYRDHDAYIVRPLLPVFGEDGSVSLGTRTMFSEPTDPRPTPRTFPSWRKVTKAMMGEAYLAQVAEYHAQSEARKVAREAREAAQKEAANVPPHL